ncbi:uncharacterized protein [Asterias amurensis]|uniref:uncharacterized protein n=1 Tax=Asterias amurensis TaxID=7602 RepID=UPI003AB1E9E8
MKGGCTPRFAVLLIIGNIFQDAISSATITIDMPPVVSVFEGEDVELVCKVWYANGTLIPPCDGLHGNILKWTLVNKVENMPGDEIARCGRVASFKNKTVEFNQDNGNLTILNIGLADEAMVKCEVAGEELGHYSNETKVKVMRKVNFSIKTEQELTPREGESPTLPCSVIDSGTTDKRNFTCVWSLNNNTILQSCNSSSEVFHSDQREKYELHHGKTSCNLTILNLTLKDEGRYQCDVHDSFYNQSNYNSTEICLGDEPTNSMSDIGSTELQTLTKETANV